MSGSYHDNGSPTFLTETTRSTAVDHASDTDSVSDLEVCHFTSDGTYDTSNFMSRCNRELVDTPVTVAGVDITVAHSAILYTNGNIRRAGLGATEFMLLELTFFVKSSEHEASFSVFDSRHRLDVIDFVLLF
jgi:hypothetical protein